MVAKRCQSVGCNELADAMGSGWCPACTQAINDRFEADSMRLEDIGRLGFEPETDREARAHRAALRRASRNGALGD